MLVDPIDVKEKMEDPRAALYENYPGGMGGWWEKYLEGQMAIVSPDLSGEDPHLQFITPLEVLKKAIQTTTGGAFNAIFSYLLQVQVAVEPNTYNALPKEPWRGPRTIGWRVRTDAVAGGVGTAQNAAVDPDTDLTFAEIEPTLKEFHRSWGMSKRLMDAVSITDSISWDQLIEQHTLDFFKAMNIDIWAALATVEGDNIEGLRNLLSSNGEITAKTLGANTVDPWFPNTTVDRDAAASFADANTLFGAAGADRTLSVALVDQLREGQERFWEGADKLDNKLFITGYDTHRRWSELEAAKQRFNAEGVVAGFGVGGGVRTSPGVKAGFKIATWDAMPVIRDDNMTSETISDLALLDLNHVMYSQLRPFEMADSDRPFEVGVGRQRALWYGSGEITMTHFQAQGVLTDLQ